MKTISKVLAACSLDESASPVVKMLSFDDGGLANALFGPQNKHLGLIAKRTGTAISSRGLSLIIEGEEKASALAATLLRQLYDLLSDGYELQPRDFFLALDILERDSNADIRDVFRDAVFVVSPRRTITPKTLTQREYVSALRTNDMTFAVGPAGTGKTYLAVAVALSFLLAKRVKRIVLTRPAVEAGERLGFLPGDMAQKINPYLKPLYDALNDMLDFERVTEMQESGIIEIAPLAFMRGRTLNGAFIILDEAQNTTPEQMKMFLTRMGFGSKVVITGDVTQIDLPAAGKSTPRSGLIHALSVLKGVEEIRILRFDERDVIRHPLVGRIVKAYEQHKNAD
ncbi:phosphate starvation protein PhoH [Deltaproteobacteria bacterium]|nr:phosphate starvation protein PhoH [Deltaproteobacteria bacterium]